ncbi:hypothetical protein EKO27_g3443 [Xylaria grammica]|uniref:Uncharacterized protein n=1 Tax=Xylaria grammica TaxID=363999 RepID=A0A439DB70_9PEZI|nr:hypothetical protein EKO27_g3443 [Xylaria grammica]GAW15031.1 hypothetical protein ANO14919_044390 [Xylariales sp. No.14919]
MPHESKTSSSTARDSSSRSSSSRAMGASWLSESSRYADSSDRFFVDGRSDRSGSQASMARKLKEWDTTWAKASSSRR